MNLLPGSVVPVGEDLPHPRADVAAQPSAPEVLFDYRIAYRSRIASELSRREALSGRAPFALPGDGKEVAQVALARVFQPGDWRSGYYRDQTLLLALDLLSLRGYFANLYADASIEREPAGGGRQMANHYATRVLDEAYRPHDLLGRLHAAADLSPIAAHLGKALGLAYASKLYRCEPQLADVAREFSRSGSEVVFATIGNGGTTEGLFWEVLNAAGVLQVPLLISVWDDGMAISVPNELQTVKSSISAAIRGFSFDGKSGVAIEVVRGDDYLGLRETYARVAERVRRDHVPALVHVTHMTQPLGHSSSGSHERYKSPERLRFERAFDPVQRMRRWILEDGLATAASLDALEDEERRFVEAERECAWRDFQAPILAARDELRGLLRHVDAQRGSSFVATLDGATAGELVLWRNVLGTARDSTLALRGDTSPAAIALRDYVDREMAEGRRRYGSHLYSESDQSPLRRGAVPPRYSANADLVDARILLRECFDRNFARDPRLLVLGEDVGTLGDVNLVFEGLQAKYGASRVTDTGVREATILGQGIGLAQRGLRPIVDIGYLDYMLYAIQLASDELSTLHHRTAGGQSAPVLIRTKGHRLQGMWHAGSPMAVLLHALRGMCLAVPRNMTQAAGMYNVLLRGDNPALLVEVLSGYRLKERLPDNIGDFFVPLGVPEVLRAGTDVTIATYGACCRIALDAADVLLRLGVSVEVIDVQTLNPFDLSGICAASVRTTGALVVVDEDVPGGASAFILQQVLERDGGFDHLELPPRTVTGAEHRTPFGQDGDYFAKPGLHEVAAAVLAVMRERDPHRFPELRPRS